MPDLAVRRDPPGAAIAPAPLGDERGRLADAVTRIATERGTRGLEPEQVALAAGLAVEDFERNFESVDQCLMLAFDRFHARMLEQIEEACDGIVSWPEKVRAAIAAAIEFIAEVEPVARLFAVDAQRTGPAGIGRLDAAIEQGALRLKHGRLLYPDSAELPDVLERTLVAGVVAITSIYLLGDEGQRLTNFQPEALEMLLSPYLGTEEARELARP
jgi:AcrR family transcriptional regulator